MKKTTTYGRNKRLMALLSLLLLFGGKMKATAEQIIATIFSEPRKSSVGYTYNLDTNNDKIIDKRTEIAYGSVGDLYMVLPDYLVKGAKIVYENKGMKNESGEFINPNRFIGIITEDGTYIRLDKLTSPLVIKAYFPYLYDLLEREKNQKN